ALRERVSSGARRVRVLTSTALETILDELGEGAGAVADPVLRRRLHLPGGQGAAQRHENPIVAKTPLAPRRAHQPSLDLTTEELDIGVRPGEGKNGNKRGAPVAVAELAVNPLHRDPEILVAAGPAGGVDAGRSAEGRDDEPGIIGERQQSARLCGG